MFRLSEEEVLANRPLSVSKGPVTSFGENFKASLNNQSLAHSFLAESETAQQALQPYIDEINKVTGKNVGNFIGSHKNLGSHLKFYNNIIKNNEELNKKYPNGIREVDIRSEARDLAFDSEVNNKEVASRYEGSGFNPGQLLGSAYGETADYLENPFTAIPMLFLGSYIKGFKVSNIARTMLYEGLIEGGLTLATRPAVKKWRNQVGLSYTWKDILSETGQATIGGALFGLPLHLTVAGLKSVFRGKQNTNNFTAEEIEGVKEQLDNDIKDLDSNPYDTPNNSEHVNNIDNQIKTLFDEEQAIENKEPRDVNVKLKPIDNPGETVKNNLYNVEELDPDDLSFDPESFQFKSEMQDNRGVTKRYASVEEWEPASRGLVVVYEDVNGKKFIVDGHQRLGMAIRFKEKGQNPKLLAHVYKASDGWTKEELMVKGAVKNIGEGTGSITDASKIFKLDKSQLPKLNITDSLVRYGNGIAKLDDDMFRMAMNGSVVDDDMIKYLGLVGEIVEDKSKHKPIIQLLMNEAKPETLFQAENIIRQANELGFNKQVQETLFGKEVLESSLFAPRAKILDNTIKSLRQKKGLFKTLNANVKSIEKEGNHLNKEANIRKEQVNAEAIEFIKRLANKKGFLSDELTTQARLLADGKTKNGQAVESFTESVVEAINRGDFTGENVGKVGDIINPEAEVPIFSRQEPGYQIDELGDKGSTDQVKNLENTVTEDLGIREGFTSDKELRLDLENKISKIVDPTDADLNMIEKHPAVVKAMDEVKSIPETHLDPNYDTDAYIANRKFTMIDKDGNVEWKAKGYIDGIEKHQLHSDQIAWKNDNQLPTEVNKNKKAIIVIGAPASGKSTIAEEIARKTRSAIVDSDEIKKSLPEYGDGVGANATHQESKKLSLILLDQQTNESKNIIIPKVGHKANSFETETKLLRAKGYEIELMYMNVDPKKAIMRMVNRFIITGRLIEMGYIKSIGNKPQLVYNQMKGKFNGYAEIDNNQPFGETPTIKEQSTKSLQGTSFRLRPSRTGRIEGRTSVNRKTETNEGSKEQSEKLNLDTVIPLSIVDDQGEISVVTKTTRELLADNKQDDILIDRLKDCV